MFDCAVGHIATWRPHLWSTTKHLLGRLVFLLRKAHRHLPVPDLFEEAATRLLTQLHNMRDFDPASRDYTYVMQRLVFCAPFSARDVREAVPMGGRRALPVLPPAQRTDMPLSLALGSLLDAIVLPRHHLRQCANVWTHWAHRNIMHLAGLYHCALPPSTDSSGPQVVRPPPCPRCRSQDAAHHQVGPFDWDDVSLAEDDDDEGADSSDEDDASAPPDSESSDDDT